MGFSADSWGWDDQSTSDQVQVSRCLQEVYFFTDPLIGSTGTVGVRGNKAFHSGEHYWEVEFLEPPSGVSVMVGVGTKSAGLTAKPFQSVNLIGQDSHSWGLSYKGKIYHNGVGRKYCDAFFESETKIGLLLNMCEGTLTFFKNGVNLGVAFSGLTSRCEPLYPMVTSTSSMTEVKVGVRRSRYLSLQDKCRAKIRHSIRHDNHIDDLPLPNIMKRYIKKS